MSSLGASEGPPLAEGGTRRWIGVVGARGFVGRRVVTHLRAMGWRVVAFSRNPSPIEGEQGEGVVWRRWPAEGERVADGLVGWFWLGPIWGIGEEMGRWLGRGARVVALSSTSVVTKAHSPSRAERALAARLRAGEERLQEMAAVSGAMATVLRATLIYGGGEDRNVALIARWIRRFGFFPVCGSAQGLRQPLHADDAAAMSVAAFFRPETAHRVLTVTGGETLPFREMVIRVFAALHRRPRIVPVPCWGLAAAAEIGRWLGGEGSAAAVRRMNEDLVFEGSEAAQVLGITPRPFVLNAEDVG
ncbi:MAG: hypothetical protein N2557_01595 [Hydrogenophilus sp.]|nr:hypothetical protein [Hydrogenophilus sp.]